MHDVSVAQGVAREILKKIRERKLEGKIKEVEVGLSLGSLRFHDTGQVSFWLGEVMKKELGKEIKVKAEFEIISPEIRCKCGFEGEPKTSEKDHEMAHHGLFVARCPGCGSKECEIRKGNECVLKNITLKQ